MNRLDQSLDDMIREDRITHKQKNHGNKQKNHGIKKTEMNTPKRTMTGRVAKTESFPIAKYKRTKKRPSTSAPIEGLYTPHYTPQTDPIRLTTKNKAPSNTYKHTPKIRESTKPTQPKTPQAKSANPLPRYEPISTGYSSDLDDLESIYEPLTYSSDSASNSDGIPELPLTPPTTFAEAFSEPDAMDIDNEKISFKRDNIISQELSIKSDESPVTIEIENLDPCTSADDVKMVCGRFGNIKSCICSGGYAQVTYTNKAEGLKAIKALHGKGTDNDKILLVTMRSTPVIHSPPLVVAVYFPSPIAERMKLPIISPEQMLNMKNTTNMIEGPPQATNPTSYNHKNYKNSSRKGSRNFRRATQA
ncbi:hypothetical protein BGX26_003598 [Mortierella sp. AD094]|nr:hypothetical protein BGX26_003598 [Mortierella sp. AD094]